MGFDPERVKNDILDGFEDLVKDEIQSAIEDHMSDQPCLVECSYCHATLNVSMSQVDSWNDLSIRVDPCNCQDEK